jgi:aspartyl-tRNA(Asn)/glutamyl-tRNA(Gln) amidotransferase subunit A
MDSDLTYSDATRLAELIRNREVTSVEVVQAHLDRIDAVNPKINAIVTWADGALDAAVAADEALAAGAAVGPLHGVPFTVKDSIDTADVMTQRGSPIFKGRSPDADATSVARIRSAGGILVAKTNLPEFSYSTETDNLLTGRSNNPGTSTAHLEVQAAVNPPPLQRVSALSVSGPTSPSQSAARRHTPALCPSSPPTAASP